MSHGYVIPVDPAELANRFASDAFDDEPKEEEEEEDDIASILASGAFEDRIAPLLNRIPQREADLIQLYYIQRKRQADIAEIFDVTQAAISYRLDRGLQRIKFLLSIPSVTEDDLRTDLPLVFKQIDVDILVGMWQTTCQSEVAKQLNLTQGRVRHRFFKAVKTLKDAADRDAKFVPYHKVFNAISSKRFNILREVRLPQWANRGGDEVI
jgi:DNA-directed RNA polymerase specialized sigma24 family protein